MTNKPFINDLISVASDKDSADPAETYDQLLSYNDDVVSEKKTDDQEFKNLIVTYSEFTNDKRTPWGKDSKDSYSNEDPNKHSLVLDDEFDEFQKDTHMPYDLDPIITKQEYINDEDDILRLKTTNEPFDLIKEIEKENEILNNQYLAFVKFVRSPVDGRSKDPRKTIGYLSKDPYTLYRYFKKQSKIRNKKYNKEYERDIELQSEITYSALKRQIAMANDKERKDPHHLYKALNRKFKKSNTEDFFRDPVAACVEVLEYVSAWIAEKLSLPPPDPVNHDLVIYKREDKSNYSYLASVVKNKKVQFLAARGVEFNDSESFAFMFVNQ